MNSHEVAFGMVSMHSTKTACCLQGLLLFFMTSFSQGSLPLFLCDMHPLTGVQVPLVSLETYD